MSEIGKYSQKLKFVIQSTLQQNLYGLNRQRFNLCGWGTVGLDDIEAIVT